jgi:hypothetical protein
MPYNPAMPPSRARVQASLTAGLNLKRKGMPAKKRIVSVGIVGGLAAAGPSFRVIRTTEIDAYEKAAKKPVTAALAAGDGATFGGTARKSAKLSISKATTEPFASVKALIDTLPSHSTMKNRTPKITKTATSKRVAEEDRNVSLKAFLYAASKEDDNDYHLIVGQSTTAVVEVYITMELSGLPKKSAKSFARLKKARKAFEDFFAGNLPGTTYDFYDPPVPIEVKGSLFWDASHATGSRPGPQSLRPKIPTVWELHPISSIKMNP